MFSSCLIPVSCAEYNSNPPVNITNNNVDEYISICNINIRSVRNKLHFLQNFADEYDILCITESNLDVKINNDDLSLDFFSKTFIRKDRNNSGGGLLIYLKDDIFVERVTALENDTDETIWIKVRARGQPSFCVTCIDLNGRTMNTEHD